MKIRIRGNSIRYRLTKTEVANFGATGSLVNKTEFGDSEFIYALESSNSIDQLAATMNGNKITLLVPEKIKNEWTTSEIIGFNHKMPIGDGKELFLLIEKDFICLDHTHEDQSDNYPNPSKVC
jgi:hypothetical protein